MIQSIYDTQRKKKKQFSFLIVFLLFLLFLSCILSMSLGSMNIAPSHTYWILIDKLLGLDFMPTSLDISLAEINIVWQIRMPRIILGLFCGAGLALCGAVMQASVDNPLAEPYILGISSGASLGATFSIMLGIGGFQFLSITGTAFWAFIGAVFSSFAVLLLSSAGSKMTSAKLVLSGTVINALCNALSNFIITMNSNAEGMQSIKFWTMGSLAGAKWNTIFFPCFLVFCCCIFFLFQHRILNTLLLGDESAITLGISLGTYRRLYMILTSLLTGVLVSVCGIIGFVGLIIPHIVRAIIGSDHKKLIPVSILCGAIFLLWADAFARIAIPNAELPIGIVTALIGAPFFAYILIKKSYRFHE